MTVENVRVLKGVLAGVSRCKIPFVNIRRLKFTKVNRKPIHTLRNFLPKMTILE